MLKTTTMTTKTTTLQTRAHYARFSLIKCCLCLSSVRPRVVLPVIARATITRVSGIGGSTSHPSEDSYCHIWLSFCIASTYCIFRFFWIRTAILYMFYVVLFLFCFFFSLRVDITSRNRIPLNRWMTTIVWYTIHIPYMHKDERHAQSMLSISAIKLVFYAAAPGLSTPAHAEESQSETHILFMHLHHIWSVDTVSADPQTHQQHIPSLAHDARLVGHLSGGWDGNNNNNNMAGSLPAPVGACVKTFSIPVSVSVCLVCGCGTECGWHWIRVAR